MAETLLTYTTKVQQECDDTSSSATVIIQQRIKETIQEILRQTKQYLITSTTNDRVVTPGTAIYTPSEFVEIILNYKPVSGDFQILKEITEREYLEKHINDEDGTPKFYFLNDGSYRLIPAPNEAGTVRETLQVVQADVNGNSVIPDRYTNVVVLGATYRFKAYEDNPSANVYKQWFQEGLRDMVNELATRSKQVRPKLYNK